MFFERRDLRKIQAHHIVLIFVLCTCCIGQAGAQAKKKKAPASRQTEEKTGSKTPEQKKDTTVRVVEIKAKEPTPVPDLVPLYSKKDTIIVIDRATGKPKISPPADTVIVLKHGKQTRELLKKFPPKDTAKVKVVTINPLCECVSLSIKAPDTLSVDDYVNYSFVLKNNCKEVVYVSSEAFSFLVFNKNGTPAKTLRKLTFNKQYKYPDYVAIEPKDTFEFQYGDDPFYQYDLHRGFAYKFTFTHMNESKKYRRAPTKTYLCNQYRDKLIMIR